MTTLVRMRRSTPPCRFLKKTLLRVHHQEIVVKKTFIMICDTVEVMYVAKDCCLRYLLLDVNELKTEITKDRKWPNQE